MMFGQYLNSHRICKRLAKALTRLRVCAGWSEPLLVAHTTLLEISCRGLILNTYISKLVWILMNIILQLFILGTNYCYSTPMTIWKFEVSKGVKIRNRYYQVHVPHLTQDTNGKVTNSQLDTANEKQVVSPFPAGDHKAHINRRAQRHSKHKAV